MVEVSNEHIPPKFVEVRNIVADLMYIVPNFSVHLVGSVTDKDISAVLDIVLAYLDEQ